MNIQWTAVRGLYRVWPSVSQAEEPQEKTSPAHALLSAVQPPQPVLAAPWVRMRCLHDREISSMLAVQS